MAQTYHACVNAVYGSGYSADDCFDLYRSFPLSSDELAAEGIECNAYLTWEQPVMSDAIDIPAFEGIDRTYSSRCRSCTESEQQHRDTTSAARSAERSPSGLKLWQIVIVDFDIDNVRLTTIAPNAAPDFVNGMAIPAEQYNLGYTEYHSTVVATSTLLTVQRRYNHRRHMGSTSFNDMHIDPTYGTIYGTRWNNLYTIDPSVPSYTMVGAHVNANLMIGIACDASR